MLSMLNSYHDERIFDIGITTYIDVYWMLQVVIVIFMQSHFTYTVTLRVAWLYLYYGSYVMLDCWNWREGIRSRVKEFCLFQLSRSHVSSNDNTQTVLDYLVTEVSAHYPEVRDWYHELDADLPSTGESRGGRWTMNAVIHTVKRLYH